MSGFLTFVWWPGPVHLDLIDCRVEYFFLELELLVLTCSFLFGLQFVVLDVKLPLRGHTHNFALTSVSSFGQVTCLFKQTFRVCSFQSKILFWMTVAVSPLVLLFLTTDVHRYALID